MQLSKQSAVLKGPSDGPLSTKMAVFDPNGPSLGPLSTPGAEFRPDLQPSPGFPPVRQTNLRTAAGFLRAGCASAGLWGGPGGLAGPGKPFPRARDNCRPRKTRQHRRIAPGGFGAWRVISLLIVCYYKYDYLFLATHVLINQLNYSELRATAETGRSRVVCGCRKCLRYLLLPKRGV